jgi:hypothetical protein
MQNEGNKYPFQRVTVLSGSIDSNSNLHEASSPVAYERGFLEDNSHGAVHGESRPSPKGASSREPRV